MAMLWMAALAAVGLVLLVRPWWQRMDDTGVRRRSANVMAYRTRLEEIEAERGAGLLEPEAAEQMRAELDARLLGDIEGAAPASAAAAGKGSRALPVLIAVALPLFAGLWYYEGDSRQTQQLIASAGGGQGAAPEMALDTMVQGLAQRLEAEPGDAEGWAMLARTYGVLERYGEAAGAFARANALSRNPDWLVGEGEALAMARDRDLLGRPRQLFEDALTLDENHVRGLWYAGLAAAQAEDFRATQAYWLRLREQELPEQLREALDLRLAELGHANGESAPLATTPAPAASAGGPSLKLDVRLADALKDRLRPGLVLFVFAKAESGPPMPLAARRIEDARLPAQVLLDDSLAMTPQFKLSSFERWAVVARLSQSGSAQAQSGDLEGSLSAGLADAAAPLTLTIDRVVP